MPPMNIREGIIIPSWPGLGVRVKEPIANSTSTKIAKAGMRLRAKMRGADQITVLDRGRDRESIHCIGSFCSCRKRELARTDNTIIVSPMAAAKMITIMRRYFHPDTRSEEHTSELQSLMRISYAVFCLKKKNITYNI